MQDTPASPSSPDARAWGSDAIADVIHALRIPYVLLNPGSSFRGLHDSLVNHLRPDDPRMLVVLHEEHAVAIAHGYAKVAGEPLAAIVHSNVGLMHATMAIYNAWADRVPVIVLGATGPVDAAHRRPWIDWLHTAQDQGALVRQFVKWDAQPASVAAAQEALLRANLIARTEPPGPVYVCFDAQMQERALPAPAPVPDVRRYQPAPVPVPSEAQVDTIAALLRDARAPVILVGRVVRDAQAWQSRVALAERLGARVLTDLKQGAAFPTAHPLHAAPAGFFLAPEAVSALRDADVVLSLDWVDLAGTLKQAWGEDAVTSRIIHVSMDQYSHNGWSMDHQGLPPVDVYCMTRPEPVVERLLALATLAGRSTQPTSHDRPAPAVRADDAPLDTAALAGALREATHGLKPTLIRLPLGWSGEMWDFEHPLDYLGYDGGGGIGSGPGMAVGAALALRDTDRLPVAVLGDGDYMMGVSALWTAAHARVPLLVIVSNNRSFFNDELHQERVAKERGRPVENRWIGQRISDPDIDLATMARGQGLTGMGPVQTHEELRSVLAQAIEAVRGGSTVVVDVRVQPGYAPAMASTMTAQPARQRA